MLCAIYVTIWVIRKSIFKLRFSMFQRFLYSQYLKLNGLHILKKNVTFLAKINLNGRLKQARCQL